MSLAVLLALAILAGRVPTPAIRALLGGAPVPTVVSDNTGATPTTGSPYSSDASPGKLALEKIE
jgi:hypothetical protein